MSNTYYTLQYVGAKTIQWKNFKDTSTPLSAANLQKSHQAIDDMDQAINAGFQAVDNTKLDKLSAGSMLAGVTYNDETGQMVFHHYDNSIPDITFNTNLQKLVVNFSYNPQTQKLMLTQADGTVVPVDLSAFVANPDLVNSDTISWTINQDGSISANIRSGSITNEMLQTDYLAQITAKANAAAVSATNSDYYSKLSKSYANGTSNLDDRPNENVDNSKYFKEEGEAWAVGKKNGTDVPSSASQYHNSAKYWAEKAAQDSGVRDMQGATSSAAGVHGLVPAPAAGDNEKFLRGDGSWGEVDLSAFTGATSNANGTKGMVPAPLIADKDKFLKGNGSWGDVDLSVFTGATPSTNGTKGMVPAPQAGDEGKALMGDGTWDYAGELSWTGTISEWNQLSASEKAEYDGKKVYIIDDYLENVPVMTGASSNDDGYKGLVPTPQQGSQNKYLNGGGIWTQDTANLITNFTSSDDATETGLIVASGETAMTALTSGDTHGGLLGLISKSVLNTRKLINTVKRVWNSVGAAWVSGQAYVLNDMVVYENGHVYKCILAHTSSSSILPTNTTYWIDTTLAAEICSLNNDLNKYQEYSNSKNSVAIAATTANYIYLDLPAGIYICELRVQGEATPITSTSSREEISMTVSSAKVGIAQSNIPHNIPYPVVSITSIVKLTSANRLQGTIYSNHAFTVSSISLRATRIM